MRSRIGVTLRGLCHTGSSAGARHRTCTVHVPERAVLHHEPPSLTLTHHNGTNNLDLQRYEAAQEGHSDVLTYLLSLGASTEGVVPRAKRSAAESTDVELDREYPLLSAEEDQGANPVHVAAAGGDAAAGANPVHLAAGAAAGANTEGDGGHAAAEGQRARSSDFSGAIYVASATGHVNNVAVLLEHGVDINKPDNDGWSALMFAAQEGHANVAKFLLERGAEVHRPKLSFRLSSLLLELDGSVRVCGRGRARGGEEGARSLIHLPHSRIIHPTPFSAHVRARTYLI